MSTNVIVAKTYRGQCHGFFLSLSSASFSIVLFPPLSGGEERRSWEGRCVVGIVGACWGEGYGGGRPYAEMIDFNGRFRQKYHS